MNNLFFDETVIISLLGSVVLGIIGWIIKKLLEKWKSTPEDYEFWVAAIARPLLTEHVKNVDDKFTFNVGDRVVYDPHLVDLYIWSAGQKDIPTNNFEDSPLVSSLGASVVTAELIRSYGNLNEVSFGSNGDLDKLYIKPQSIKVGSALQYRAICDGAPQITFHNPVVDLSCNSYIDDWLAHRSRFNWERSSGVFLIFIFFGVFVLNLVYGDSSFFQYDDIKVAHYFLLPTLAFLGVYLIISGSDPSPRGRRASSTLRKSLNARMSRRAQPGLHYLPEDPS